MIFGSSLNEVIKSPKYVRHLGRPDWLYQQTWGWNILNGLHLGQIGTCVHKIGPDLHMPLPCPTRPEPWLLAKVPEKILFHSGFFSMRIRWKQPYRIWYDPGSLRVSIAYPDDPFYLLRCNWTGIRISESKVSSAFFAAVFSQSNGFLIWWLNEKPWADYFQSLNRSDFNIGMKR